MASTFPRDVDDYLPHGRLKDYPIDRQNSRNHFSDKIIVGSRLSHELTESELFNVICESDICKPRLGHSTTGYGSFRKRMRYSDWCRHHSAVHPNGPRNFCVVSFWSTCFNGYGYDTEYRLVSMDPSDRELIYLKPLDAIYSNDGNKKPTTNRCSYCHSTTGKLLRCSGCKILFYCNTECQRKHWKLIHKQNCKKYRRKYKKRTLTQQEIDDIDRDASLELSKMAQTHYGDKVEKFKEMINERVRCGKGKDEKKEPELLMPEAGENFPLNIWWTSMMKAFDRDGDGKLCFEEWKTLWQTLGFRTVRDIQRFQLRGAPIASWKHLFYQIAAEPWIALLPEYEPSLSSGVYGGYLYPNATIGSPILFGKQQIIETLGYCAFFKMHDSKNEDPEFEKKFDFGDAKASTQRAFSLLSRLLGHAMHMTVYDESSRAEEKVYDAIMEAVPFLDKDTVSIIYDFQSITLSHFLNVSWHRIEWTTLPDDTEGIWNAYDRESEHQHFDLFYLKKQDEKGYDDVSLQIEICDDIEKCNEKLKCLEDRSPFGFSMANMMDNSNRKQRWCLGMCAAYIPMYSFVLRDHAKLIGKVLKYHNLNPVQCHYIYVGEQFDIKIENKEKIVNEYNAVFGSKTKFRPHAPKKPANLFGSGPLGFGGLFD